MTKWNTLPGKDYKILESIPSLISSLKYPKAFFSLPSKISLNKDNIFVLSANPSISLTLVSLISLVGSIVWAIRALSKREIASLTEPSEVLAISLIASSAILPFSFVEIEFK